MKPFLSISKILTSLQSHIDPTKELFVMIQYYYDDEPITLFHMTEVNQEVVVLLHILHES